MDEKKWRKDTYIGFIERVSKQHLIPSARGQVAHVLVDEDRAVEVVLDGDDGHRRFQDCRGRIGDPEILSVYALRIQAP